MYNLLILLMCEDEFIDKVSYYFVKKSMTENRVEPHHVFPFSANQEQVSAVSHQTELMVKINTRTNISVM